MKDYKAKYSNEGITYWPLHSVAKFAMLFPALGVVIIRVYDSDSFSFDAVEYKSEFEQRSGSPRERIHHAAEWLSNAIVDKRIIV